MSLKKHLAPIIAMILCPSFLFAQRQDSLRSTPKPLHFSIRQVQIPAGLIVAGLLSTVKTPESIKGEVVEKRNELMPGFKTHIDNYLQHAPIAIAYGLDAFGVQSKTDFLNRTAILIKGEMAMVGIVAFLKKKTQVIRPDGTTSNSFPSGHTAKAFAGATFLSEEYKDRFTWMPFAAYGLAGSVGLLRMANNRHYISDVLVGAGLGILSMKAAYWTHQYKWGRKSKEKTITVF